MWSLRQKGLQNRTKGWMIKVNNAEGVKDSLKMLIYLASVIFNLRHGNFLLLLKMTFPRRSVAKLWLWNNVKTFQKSICDDVRDDWGERKKTKFCQLWYRKSSKKNVKKQSAWSLGGGGRSPPPQPEKRLKRAFLMYFCCLFNCPQDS